MQERERDSDGKEGTEKGTERERERERGRKRKKSKGIERGSERGRAVCFVQAPNEVSSGDPPTCLPPLGRGSDCSVTRGIWETKRTVSRQTVRHWRHQAHLDAIL